MPRYHDIMMRFQETYCNTILLDKGDPLRWPGAAKGWLSSRMPREESHLDRSTELMHNQCDVRIQNFAIPHL